MIDLLGMPAEQAIQKMRDNGIEGQMVITSAPKTRYSESNEDDRRNDLRVIAQRGDLLICAKFRTTLTGEEKNG